MSKNNHIIRFASREDIPDIMEFIDKNWKKGHILAVNRDFFEYTYVYGDEVCIVMLENSETGEMEGMLGYIPYDWQEPDKDHYGGSRDSGSDTGETSLEVSPWGDAPSDGKRSWQERGGRDIFTAIWKVVDRAGFLSGTRLITHLEKNGGCRGLYCVGLAEKVIPLMQLLGKEIVDYEHYFMLNPYISDPKISLISENTRELFKGLISEKEGENGSSSTSTAEDVSVRQIWDFKELAGVSLENRGHLPYKSDKYIERRYFRHPVYDYKKHLFRGKASAALLITREQEALGSRILRIIDIIGDISLLTDSFDFFEGLFKSPLSPGEGYEYIDCLFSESSPLKEGEGLSSGTVPGQDAHRAPGTAPERDAHRAPGTVPERDAHTPTGTVPEQDAHTPPGTVPERDAHTPTGTVPAQEKNDGQKLPSLSVVLQNSGFIKKAAETGDIIPNYFEPFLQENITIHNFYPGGKSFIMFRGDGDQDRPSKI